MEKGGAIGRITWHCVADAAWAYAERGRDRGSRHSGAVNLCLDACVREINGSTRLRGLLEWRLEVGTRRDLSVQRGRNRATVTAHPRHRIDEYRSPPWGNGRADAPTVEINSGL